MRLKLKHIGEEVVMAAIGLVLVAGFVIWWVIAGVSARLQKRY